MKDQNEFDESQRKIIAATRLFLINVAPEYRVLITELDIDDPDSIMDAFEEIMQTPPLHAAFTCWLINSLHDAAIQNERYGLSTNSIN